MNSPKTKEFIDKARNVHGNRYDYSKVEYTNCETKVCIICKEHGEFWQAPIKHLKGQGCSQCSKYRTRYTTESLIEAFKKIHGDKFDYSKVEYKNIKEKVCITCPTHGDFWQTPNKHLMRRGCRKCQYEQISRIKTKSLESFIEDAKKVHGDKYDYSKVEYVNCDTKVCITCKEHGEFWQRPNDHLNGKGCPRCQSSKLEDAIRIFLLQENIEFEEQKRFKWLRMQSLDFYLPQYNVAIECQGIQHFQTFDFFGGTSGFKRRVERDTIKRVRNSKQKS